MVKSEQEIMMDRLNQIKNLYESDFMSIRDNLLKQRNMRLEKSTRDGLDCFYENLEDYLTSIYENTKGKKPSSQILSNLIVYNLLAKGDFREIILDKEIYSLLLNTDNDDKKAFCLFPNYFINVIFPIDNFYKEKYYHAMIEGIYINCTTRLNEEDENESNVRYHLSIKCWKKEGGIEIVFIDGEFEQNTDNLPQSEKDIHNIVRKYIVNLHNFMTHPEVEIVNKEYYNNQKREKRGLPKIPIKTNLIIRGTLKKYINNTLKENEQKWQLGYKIWVRGYWMNFSNLRYIHKRGQKKWVLPYIRGKGELINKKTYIGSKEQEWIHQKLMVSIIRDIYFDKKVKTNIRTILEGLEIDCYIPELKLGFEYNGEQHYNWIKEFHKTEEEFEAQKQRDIKKNQLAIEKGIKLITIKYDEPLSKELILTKLKEGVKDGIN